MPSSAQFAITVWETIAPRKVKPVGGTTLRLFGKQLYVVAFQSNDKMAKTDDYDLVHFVKENRNYIYGQILKPMEIMIHLHPVNCQTMKVTT